MQDNLFESSFKMPKFEFNQTVVNVFDDMISRSVPFYQHILKQVAQLIGGQATVYDLGCSTGALVPVLKQICSEFTYHGIDKSISMIEKARQYESPQVHFYQGDLAEGIQFNQPTAIVCNLVLQFIDPSKRASLIHQYMASLPLGGKLIIVEKVRQNNEELQSIYTKIYHKLKRENGYSQAEIDNKDAALKGVLLPETSEFYFDALSNAGAATIDLFFKWCNFEGFVAIK